MSSISIPVQIDFVATEDTTFDQWEAPRVVENYVCGVCWGELTIEYLPNEARVFIICPEHGSVCRVGRVTRNTVSINYEMASSRYHQAIKNVSEWAVLVPPAKDRKTTGANLREMGF